MGDAAAVYGSRSRRLVGRQHLPARVSTPEKVLTFGYPQVGSGVEPEHDLGLF